MADSPNYRCRETEGNRQCSQDIVAILRYPVHKQPTPARQNRQRDWIMSRNLVICCDGTSNQFGPENTNVVRLTQVLDRDSVRQRLYYDPGVGTLPEPGLWSWLAKKLSEGFGLAFGTGLTQRH